MFAKRENRITEPLQRENLGIIVQYKVKVKLCLGPLGGDVVGELPFTLMHPKPEPESGSMTDLKAAAAAAVNGIANEAHEQNPIVVNGEAENGKVEAIDHNLIQLE